MSGTSWGMNSIDLSAAGLGIRMVFCRFERRSNFAVVDF